MLKKIGRLFVIKNRFEAFVIIYALALGAMSRGVSYLEEYPGNWGWALFFATSGAVFLAGAKILDALRMEKELQELRAPSEQSAE
ncbi:hypothetical protein [Erythrobacter sp. F6033]|uniref:hypothetical protein n=1 Tax=Erythrobacter sp. F6033 TaxID=2926401 RepID=UPI001FF51D84|nr:hypothetical protein [Erythrobacter sp. F6033]MCK0127834.1 hypothetical protein [Erythrobacter sp. F6033]